MTQYILAIDPGTTESAFALLSNDYQLIDFAILKNLDLKEKITSLSSDEIISEVAIEGMACYGKSVGREVFDTCIWIGRYSEFIESLNIPVSIVYRKDVKMNLCGKTKAKDTDVRKALIARFAKHDFKNGKGTKDNRDYFYGVKADCWSAIAIATTYIDKLAKE